MRFKLSGLFVFARKAEFMNPEIDFDKMQGLAPAIVQDAASGEVLMLGFMNREACERTLVDRLRDVFQPHSQPTLDQRRDLGQPAQGWLPPPPIAIATHFCCRSRSREQELVCHEGTRSCFTQSISAERPKQER